MSRIDRFFTQEQIEQALVGEQKQPEPDIREIVEGNNKNATKKIEEGLAKDVEIQATGKVN
jgi:hypothetical protein